MSRKIFLDGEWIAATPQLEESLLPWRLPGKGVFETMRSYDGKIFALDAHLKRLAAGLKALGIRQTFSKAEIKKRLAENFIMNPFKNARIRLIIRQNKEKIHISVAAQKHRPFAGRVYRKGFRFLVSSVRCRSGKRFCNVKSIRYELYLKAYQEVLKRGGEEAILLNKRREITEASRSNIFIVKNGVVFTPALVCGCLNGVTRGIVIQLAQKSGIPVKESKFFLKDLLKADEAFLTNSIMEIMPVSFCHGRPIGRGKPGPITKRLRVLYSRATLGF